MIPVHAGIEDGDINVRSLGLLPKAGRIQLFQAPRQTIFLFLTFQRRVVDCLRSNEPNLEVWENGDDVWLRNESGKRAPRDLNPCQGKRALADGRDRNALIFGHMLASFLLIILENLGLDRPVASFYGIEPLLQLAQSS